MHTIFNLIIKNCHLIDLIVTTSLHQLKDKDAILKLNRINYWDLEVITKCQYYKKIVIKINQNKF